MPESRKNEITVRQGFAARHHNGGVKRLAGKRRRPKILLRCVHRAYRIQNPRKTTLQSRHTAPVSCSNSTIKCHPYHFRLKTQADRTMRISQNATRNSRDRRVCTGNRGKDFKPSETPLFPTVLVGLTGFEPATFCSQSRRATKLRYSPFTFTPRESASRNRIM